MLEKSLLLVKKAIPTKVFSLCAPAYHYSINLLGAILYRFPSKEITVVGVTGTKGKSTTVELINAILEEAGFTTALSGTVRFKIGNSSKENLYKMSMPGRFVLQRFLRKAVSAGCTYAVMEITSQGVLQHRQKFIDLDALVFTNLSPEHIESHGSYENYRDAKLTIAKGLEQSKKKRRIIVVNKDDKESPRFLAYKIPENYSFSLKDAEPYTLFEEGSSITIDGTPVNLHVAGEFNIYNTLAAVTFAKTQNIGTEIIIRALEKFNGVPGRVQKIDEGQDFKVIIDYAHTPDSLQKIYGVFPKARKICVLGSTGGGRDTWKRAEMAKIAERHCEHIILTDDDSYDDDPREITAQMKAAITTKDALIEIDRRLAIRKAFELAKPGDAVLITGKGTDPYLMGPNGAKIPWSDAQVAREELQKVVRK